MKINEIIELSSTFSAEVNVDRDFHYQLKENNTYIDGYLPNRSSRAIVKSIFETLSTRDDRKLHLITASYGTGKSYLLLILAYLLGNKNIYFFKELERKIADKDDLYADGLTTTLQQYWATNGSYLIVIPKYGTEDFEQGMLAALNLSLAANDIKFVPETNFIRAAEMLEEWQRINLNLYEQLQELLPNKNGEDFIRLLKDCDGSSYILFKKIYKQIIFTDFSENHGDIYLAFQETAHHIATLGYKGIVVIYDEFGGVLDTLINKSQISSTNKIQNFLEDVKDKKDSSANLIFIAANHQDPNTIKENKQQNIDKLLGRFERYRLEVADAESEELIGKVFQTTNKPAKETVLNAEVLETILDEVADMELYPDKAKEWIISRIIKGLYPLHPLTSYILPRLSNQFAQNNRSMFNFLNPNEASTGSLRKFLDFNETHDVSDGKINLFTPDMLLTFFRPNLTASSAVNAFVDAFDGAMGKVDDPVIQRLMGNILILTVSRRKEVRPTYEVLYNAMQAGSSNEFKNLLDDLVNNDLLEFNPKEKTYEFPIVGTRSFGKIYEEEKKKLQDLNLFSCQEKWESVQQLEEYKFINHQDKFGANRSYKSLGIVSSEQLKANLDDLRKIYNGELREQAHQGFVIYLLIQDELFIETFKTLLLEYKDVVRYLIFAKPKDADLFNKLIADTVELEAYTNTANHIDIKSNPNHADKVRNAISKARSEVSNTVKQTFSPPNWQWSFNDLDTWSEIKNARVLESSMDAYIDNLFTDVLDVKDDALWFGRSSTANTKGRFAAITMILTADKGKIPLYNGNNNSHENRILSNFFTSRKLARDTGTGPNIQYGEISVPKPGTPWEKVWKFIDQILKVNEIVTPDKFLVPLLRAPYGLSEQMIKFFFTCYVRSNTDILIFTDPKNTFTIYDKSASIIEEIFKKPQNYGIRKIEMSDFARRYVKALHGLFSKEGAVNSFENVSKRFETSNFFTALQTALIKKDPEIHSYYGQYLIPFLEKLKEIGVDRENEAKDFFMDILPPFIIRGITREEFENDPDNISVIVNKLKTYKEYPAFEETSFKLEVLKNLGSQVFGKTTVTTEEFKRTVKDWFAQLNPNTRSVAQFENEKIRLWLRTLRSGENTDILKFYLDELPVKPIKDWEDLFDDRSVYINTLLKYKEEIDNYKKSPIEVYQFIARECFQLSAAECSTEQTFIDIFQGWWDLLPQLNREAHFEQDYVNLFIKEFNSSASMLQKLLAVVPIKWKDAGLLNIMTNEWDSWTQDEVRTVAKRYADVVSIISEWQAPIAEAAFIQAIAEIFQLENITAFGQLDEQINQAWLGQLPYNTQAAKWPEGSDEALLLKAIKEKNLRNFFIKDLPSKFNLKDFKFWNNEILNDYLKKVIAIRASVEAYKRPVMELISELEKRLKTKSSTVTEFRATLKDNIVETEAYINKAEDQDGLLVLPAAVLFLRQLRTMNTDAAFITLIDRLAVEFNISEAFCLWLPEVQTSFVKSFGEMVKYIKEWKFPEEQLLSNAKEKIGSEIRELQSNMQLTDFQLLKILRDFIDESLKAKP